TLDDILKTEHLGNEKYVRVEEIERLREVGKRLREWYNNIDVLPSADGLEIWTRDAFEELIKEMQHALEERDGKRRQADGSTNKTQV
ncbi:hypothetical protein LCGC14_2674250, partial [marine sediment metagenome]